MPIFALGLLPRILIPLLLALALAGLGAGLTYRVMAGKVAQATTERDQLSAALAAVAKQREVDVAVLARRAKANAAAARSEAAKRKSLEAALKANPTWAEQPLPPDVLDALKETP